MLGLGLKLLFSFNKVHRIKLNGGKYDQCGQWRLT